MDIRIAQGHVVRMRATHPLHYREEVSPQPTDDVAGTFSEALSRAIGTVNNLQIEAEDLSRRMITEPESVNIHTVMIAAQKAEVALSFTRAVRDEVIRTVRELMNLR
ncbi:MAG: flagellar hook-basal body complex protein FliE [Spirochaetes bacterium]|nr:flagellar hook-basal body complex protein FliE [Spirochaetota bacterium]